MAITVVIFDESGAPLPEGVEVELVREKEVVAEARTDGRGAVTFDVDGARPLAVRLRGQAKGGGPEARARAAHPLRNDLAIAEGHRSEDVE